mmetsp:Transcript_31288/g.100352  ORF Transcript_31288/g.100352 Transcript_31288/m.100352 type:complete len:201 (-) Transcript_31288:271-873(-)
MHSLSASSAFRANLLRFRILKQKQSDYKVPLYHERISILFPPIDHSMPMLLRKSSILSILRKFHRSHYLQLCHRHRSHCTYQSYPNSCGSSWVRGENSSTFQVTFHPRHPSELTVLHDLLAREQNFGRDVSHSPYKIHFCFQKTPCDMSYICCILSLKNALIPYQRALGSSIVGTVSSGQIFLLIDSSIFLIACRTFCAK